MKNAAVYLGIGLLFTHELDAMPNHEWRVLPVIRSLADPVGESVFLLAHVPIFALVIACIASLNIRTRKIAQFSVGIFLIVHGLVHYLFSGHTDYEFSSLVSSVLIYGAALCGIVYLAIVRLETVKNHA